MKPLLSWPCCQLQYIQASPPRSQKPQPDFACWLTRDPHPQALPKAPCLSLHSLPTPPLNSYNLPQESRREDHAAGNPLPGRATSNNRLVVPARHRQADQQWLDPSLKPGDPRAQPHKEWVKRQENIQAKVTWRSRGGLYSH